MATLDCAGAQAAEPRPGRHESYPAKPVRLIVPFPPGAATDSIGRILAIGMGDALGRTLIVDNRGGAGGTIGTGIAARATPDGHTLVLGTLGTQSINPALYPKMDHDPAIDLAPVTMVAIVSNVLVVNVGLPVQSVAELIRFARRRPGELNYGSAGNGSSLHLGAELFKSVTGITMTHIPYRGGALALGELLGGHIHMMFNSVPLALPHLLSGKLRALAVTGERRATSLPEVPTMRESGVTGFEFENWFALFVPARTPFRLIDWLGTEVSAVLRHGATRERLLAIGAEPVSSAPAEVGSLVRQEFQRWKRVIDSAGITPD